MSRMSRRVARPVILSRSEQKAANIDSWVKTHLAERRAADASKTTRLKALRAAREAAGTDPDGVEPPADQKD